MRTSNPIILLVSYISGRKWFDPVMLFLWCFSIYSEIPLSISSTKSIPSITLVLLLPLIFHKTKEYFTLRHLVFFLSVVGIAILSLMPQAGNFDLSSVIVRLLQFAYSVLMGVVTLVYIQSLSLVTVRKVMGFFCAFIFIGCLLERLGIISAITTAYHGVYANTGYGGEVDLSRDLTLSGFARPFFFTSEPSLVGLGFFCFSSAYTMLNDSKVTQVIFLISHFIMVALLGSPTILLSVVMWIIINVIRYKINPLKILLWGAGVYFLISLFANSDEGKKAIDGLLSRFTEEIFTEGSSMYARIYVPYNNTLPAIMQHYPFLGVGFGNHELQKNIFGYKGFMEEYELQFVFGANSFVSFIANFGLCGVGLLLFSIYRLQKSLRIHSAFLIISFWFLQAQIIGTFVTPRTWCNLTIFIGVCYLNKNYFYKSKSNALLNTAKAGLVVKRL